MGDFLCFFKSIEFPPRRAEDVKASPKLPPGSPYSPPEEKRGVGGGGSDVVFGESNYYAPAHGEDVRSDGGGSLSSSVRGLYSSQNSSSHINYNYQDILRLGG